MKGLVSRSCAFALIVTLVTATVMVLLHDVASSDYRVLFSYTDSIPALQRAPDVDTLSWLRAHRHSIVRAARTHGVDPIAVAGVILAERSLHHGPVNYFEDYYVRHVLLRLTDEQLAHLAERDLEFAADSRRRFHMTSRANHSLVWSVGPCQVSIIGSIRRETQLAALQRRQAPTVRHVINALLEVESGLNVCASELARAQQTYAEVAGVDISGRPEILATLFNLGGFEARAAACAAPGRCRPRPNHFGAYVAKHVHLLRRTLAL